MINLSKIEKNLPPLKRILTLPTWAQICTVLLVIQPFEIPKFQTKHSVHFVPCLSLPAFSSLDPSSSIKSHEEDTQRISLALLTKNLESYNKSSTYNHYMLFCLNFYFLLVLLILSNKSPFLPFFQLKAIAMIVFQL